ncbi:unnamed protein product [Linum trigynum]|uniref:Integrase catalytic domain-containing protein n=1 Tax=Linum trigynum TaxID=586398 RepID=A0AAV2GB61_9ROSI
MVSTQFGKVIKILRSDPGDEFVSHPLQDMFRQTGILSQQSYPGVSQQNGVVERKNCHVLELTRALLFHSQFPPRFWVEAVHTVVYLIDRQITPVLDQRSPYQVLFSRLPDYTWLRVFGCVCYVLLPRRERHKLSPEAVKCVFVGYSNKHKGYACYDVAAHRLRISCHVVFLEHNPYYASDTSINTSQWDFLARLPSFPAAPASPDLDDVDPPLTSPHTSLLSFTSDSSPSLTASASSSSSQSTLGSSTSKVAEVPPLIRSNQANKGQPPASHSDFVAYSAV